MVKGFYLPTIVIIIYEITAFAAMTVGASSYGFFYKSTGVWVSEMLYKAKPLLFCICFTICLFAYSIDIKNQDLGVTKFTKLQKDLIMKSKLLPLSLILQLCTFALFAAQSPYWLGSNSQADGSMQSQNTLPIATDFQATASSIEAFIYFGDNNNPVVTNGLNYLTTNHNNKTEQLARIIQIQSQIALIDQTLVDELLTRINADGGIGEDIGFSSNVLDSSWALLAFASVDNIDSQIISSLLTYIITHKQADNGYSYYQANESSVYVSSLVSLALNKYKTTFNFVINEIQAVNQFIIGKQQVDGGWGEIHENALALIALAQSNYNAASYWVSVLHLRGSQTGTGVYNTHWNEEVYTTALALIASDKTSHMTEPADYGSITAILVDSISNEVVNGAIVSLDNGVKTDYSTSQGVFQIGNILHGNHSIEISYTGYQTESINFDLQAGENKNLGVISLVKTPSTGLIKGIMKDATTQTPLSNAQIEVTADITYNTTTDSLGRFQLEINPGNFTLLATAYHYNGLQATGTINAGEVININLPAYPTGIVIDEAEIMGKIIANDTNLPIANAKITIANTDYFSNELGDFQISALPIGQTTIHITALNYQNLTINAYLTGGTVNFGDLHLFAVASTSSTIHGLIKSNITNQGLANVNVSILGTNLSGLSAQDGSYQIIGIQNSNYKIQFSFPSYQSIVYQVSSQEHASTELNLTLNHVSNSPITVTKFLPEHTEYKGAQEVEFDIELRNDSIQAVKTRLFVRVKNSNDVIMAYYPIKEIPSNGVLDDALDTLLANQTYATTASWSTRFMSPDVYTIDLLAYTENGVDLLAQGSTTIEVLPAKVASGKVTFNPENTNFDPNQQIDISANIYSSGNQAIGNVDVTAEVYLVDKKDNSTNLNLALVDDLTDPLLTRPHVLHKNSSGELLIFNANYGTIVKLNTNETFEAVATVGNIQDFDSNASDQIFTLDYWCTINKYESDGTLLNSFATGVSNCRKIELLNDGTLHFVSESAGIYNYNPVSGLVTQVVGSYFQHPQGVLKHSDGRILIADGDSNSILNYQNDQLTKWIDGLSNPHGLCEDTDGSVLVANYGSNEIVRIQADGSTSVLNNTIQKPYDIKRNTNGGYYVSSEQDNTIYQLNNDGSTTIIYESFIKRPSVIVSGNNSDEYIYNSLDKSIVHRLSDGTTSIVLTTANAVNAMTVATNDRLIIAMTDNVYRLEVDSSLTALSATSINVQRIEATNIPTEFLVYLTEGKIRKLDTVTQSLVDYIQSPFEDIVTMQTDSTGLLYILDNTGTLITVDQNMEYQRVKTGLNTPLDMFISASDEIYIAQGDKTIIKLDNTYSVIQTTLLANSPYNFVIKSNGDILYSDYTKTIYKHDGSTESIYVTASGNITGDIAIDNTDSLLVTFGNSNIERIDSSLNKTTIATGLSRAQSIVIDNTGGAWVSYFSGVFYLDASNNITTTYTSAATPNAAQMAMVNNQFFMANSDILHQFDASFNLMKKYSGFTSVYDLDRLSNNDTIISSPYKLLRYTSPTQLAELLKSDHYYQIEEKDSTHLFVLSYYKLAELDLTTGNTIDLYDSTNDGGLAIVDNKIHLVEKFQNKYTELNFSGNEQFKQYGLVSLQGMTVDENNTLYFDDYYGVYKFSSLNNADKIEDLEGVGYMVNHAGVIYKSNTYGSELMAKDLISGHVSRLSSGPLSSLAYLANNELFLASTYGLKKYKINGTLTNLLSNVDKVTDIVQKDNGKIYLMNGSSSGGILELTGNVISQYKNKDELLNMYSYSLGSDNDFLYIHDSSLIIQVSDTGIRKVTTPIKLPNARDLIEILGSNVYLSDSDNNLIYKFELRDPLTDVPAIGDLVHSSTVNMTLTENEQEINFAPFVAPIAGDYEVRLSLSDSEALIDTNKQIHVGSVAQGLIQISNNTKEPGDIDVPTSVSIDGIDIETYTSINPDELQMVDTGSVNNFFNSMMADNGDIYYMSQNVYVHRIDSFTKQDSYIYHAPEVIKKIIKDSAGNIILLGYYSKAFFIEPDGTISKTIDFGMLTGDTGPTFGDIDYDDYLILHKGNSLFKIDTNTNTSTLIYANLPTNERDLVVSRNGNYFLYYRWISVFNPINKTLITIKGEFSRENEYGDNLVVVCEDIPIYTEPSFGEEEDLYAGARRSLIFHLDDADLDGISYDRNQANLLLHGDTRSWTVNNGLHTLPVHCGKMYVELHLTDQNNTSLNSFDIPPDQILEVGLNTHEYIWIIDELDTVQKLFNFQTQIDDLLPNETRPILSSAYLKFKNSLNPQQDLTVNLDIPSITGVIDRSLDLALDNNHYQGNSDITITNTVHNTALSTFDGYILQHIEDAAGHLVVSLAQLDVTNLAASTQLDLPTVWNTQNYYAGDYSLVSKLFDATGNLQDEKTASFTVIPSEVNQASVAINVLTDKSQYADTDTVVLSPSITNLSDNNIIQSHTAQVIVTDPDNIAIMQKTVAVNNLSPNAIQSWQNDLYLNKAKVGSYTVSVNLIDSNNIIIANQTTNFNVVRDEQLSMQGSVLVANEQIQPPATNSCHYELTNTATEAINNIEIHQTVVNLSNQLTMQDDVISINLASNESWVNDQTINTDQLSSGDHACILRTIINNSETTQASDIFFVQGANQISGTLWFDDNADGNFDNTESGIANVEIKLLNNNQQIIQTKTSNSNGIYQFDPVANGQYTLQVTETGVLQGHYLTAGNNPRDITIENNHQQINFGYRQDIYDLSVFTTNCLRGLKPDQDVSYRVTVNNLGNMDINQAQLQDILPINLDNISWTCQALGAASCSNSGNTDINDTVNMPRGSQLIYTINATVNAQLGDQLTNQVSIVLPTGITDDYPSNNSAIDSDTVMDIIFANGFDCAAPTPIPADIFDLAISTSNCVNVLSENQEINYTIQVSNLGNTNINQAQVNSPIPQGLANVSWVCQAQGNASCTATGTGAITDTVDLGKGSSIAYTLDATVSAQLLEIITSNASITLPNGITDDFPNNNTAQDSDMVLDLLFSNGFDCAKPTPHSKTQTQQQKILWSMLEDKQTKQISQNTPNQPIESCFINRGEQ